MVKEVIKIHLKRDLALLRRLNRTQALVLLLMATPSKMPCLVTSPT